jgi:hypothetical protein
LGYLFATHALDDNSFSMLIILRGICYLRSECAAFVPRGQAFVYVHHRFVRIRQLLLRMGPRLATDVFVGRRELAGFVKEPTTLCFLSGNGAGGPFGELSAKRNYYLLRALAFASAGSSDRRGGADVGPDLDGDVGGVPLEVRPQTLESIRAAVDGVSPRGDELHPAGEGGESAAGQIPEHTLPPLLLDGRKEVWGSPRAPEAAVGNRMADPMPLTGYQAPSDSEPALDLFPTLAAGDRMDEAELLMHDMMDPRFDFTRDPPLGFCEGSLPIRPMWDRAHPSNAGRDALLITATDCLRMKAALKGLIGDPDGKLEAHPCPSKEELQGASVTQMLFNYTVRVAECQGGELLAEARLCSADPVYGPGGVVFSAKFIALIRPVFEQGAAGTGKGYAIDVVFQRVIESRQQGKKMTRTGGTLCATFVIKGVHSTIYTFGLNCRSLATQLVRILFMFPFEDGIDEYTVILDEYTVNAGDALARLLGGLYEFNMMMYKRYGAAGLSVFILIFAGCEGQLGGVRVVNLPESSLVAPVAMKGLGDRKVKPQPFPEKSTEGKSPVGDEAGEVCGDEGEAGELAKPAKKRYTTIAHVMWWIQEYGLSIRLVSQQRTRSAARKGCHKRMHELVSCALAELRQNFCCSALGQQIIKDACSKESAMRRWRRQYLSKHPGKTFQEADAYARDSLTYMKLRPDAKREMPLAAAHPNRDCTRFHSYFLRHTRQSTVISVLSASKPTPPVVPGPPGQAMSVGRGRSVSDDLEVTSPAVLRDFSPGSSDALSSGGSSQSFGVRMSFGSASSVGSVLGSVAEMSAVSSDGANRSVSSSASLTALGFASNVPSPSFSQRGAGSGGERVLSGTSPGSSVPGRAGGECQSGSPLLVRDAGRSIGSASPSGVRAGGVRHLAMYHAGGVPPLFRGSPLPSGGSTPGASGSSSSGEGTPGRIWDVRWSPSTSGYRSDVDTDLSSSWCSSTRTPDADRERGGVGEPRPSPYGALKGDGSLHLAPLMLHRLRIQDFPQGGLYNGSSCKPVWYIWGPDTPPPHPPLYTLVYLDAYRGPPLLHADLKHKLRTDVLFKPVRDFFLERESGALVDFYDKLVLIRSTTSGHRSVPGLQVPTLLSISLILSPVVLCAFYVSFCACFV